MFTFKTAEEYERVYNIVKNSVLYWKKIRQDAQGKICMQCDGSPTHYSIRYAEENMQDALKMIEEIENTPHYEWNGEEYVWIEACEYPSAIITSNRAVLNKEFPYDPTDDLNNYTSGVDADGSLVLEYHPPA